MTQWGLRKRRSYEETRAERVAKSATGPGKPYSNRPAGLTGALRTAAAEGTGAGWATKTCEAGTGTGTEGEAAPVDVVVVVIDVAVVWVRGSFLSDRNTAAVTAAPVPALTAAMIARVAFDMVLVGGNLDGLLVRQVVLWFLY